MKTQTNKTQVEPTYEDAVEIRTEPQEYERVEQDLLVIDDIYCKQDKKTGDILGVYFVSGEEKVSYKPQLRQDKVETLAGMKILKEERRLLKDTELPLKLKLLNTLFNKTGELRLLCDYTIWHKVGNDGKKYAIKFMSERDFNNSYPVDKNNKEMPLI